MSQVIISSKYQGMKFIPAGAEILVSGDQDLLVVAQGSPIRILSPRAFMTLARG